jgi:hypothetical protein
MYGINHIESKCRLPFLKKNRKQCFCQLLQEITQILTLENANKNSESKSMFPTKRSAPLSTILPTFLRFYTQVNYAVRIEHRNVGFQLYQCTYSANFARPYQRNTTQYMS